MSIETKQLEKNIDILRSVLRDVIPIVDWALMQAGAAVEPDKSILDYIDHVQPEIRNALNITLPVPEAEGNPRN